MNEVTDLVAQIRRNEGYNETVQNENIFFWNKMKQNFDSSVGP